MISVEIFSTVAVALVGEVLGSSVTSQQNRLPASVNIGKAARMQARPSQSNETTSPLSQAHLSLTATN
ncbi:hypothetical protein E2C01_052941 [Portunus trituberculatus]|uniref:Uncharacterized protein n=1 Tax=Portunus trituberculatus TaxID=210409 RepID=A0A5B7GPI3_PORTR|nr:hypothetical protein [Portunus trituberculatus]